MKAFFSQDVLSIPRRFEQAFANSLVFGRSGDSFWIGLSDQGSPKSFHWLSGDEVSYTNWNRDQPGECWSVGSLNDKSRSCCVDSKHKDSFHPLHPTVEALAAPSEPD